MIKLIKKSLSILIFLVSYLNTGEFEFYKESCDEGYIIFCPSLGFMYEEGKEIKQDYIKAEQLYKKSCRNDDYMGCMGLERLAEMYYNQLDYEKSKVLFRELCNNDHINSCYNLGVQYEESKNYLKAKKLYTKACKENHLNACLNLGFLYYHGLGITKDYSKSFELFNRTCNKNNIHGCYNLGLMYGYGQFVKKDINKANKLFKKVCNSGEKKGCQSISRLKKITELKNLENHIKSITNPFNPMCINDIKRATYTMMSKDGQDENTSSEIAFTLAKNLSKKKNKYAAYTVYEYENTNKYHFSVIKNNECTLIYVGYTKNEKSHANISTYIDKQPIIGCTCQ